MIELRRVGRFFPLSPEGYIVNDCDLSHIDPALGAKVCEFYRKQFGDKLHSVYVRGSVARGNFVPDISDLDTFAVVDDDVPKAIAGAEVAAKQLREEFPAYIDIVLVAVSLSTILSDRRNPFTFLLQTQSVCIFGPSLQDKLPPYRPNIEIIGEALYLKDRFTLYRKEIAEINDADAAKFQCSVLMKGVVRSCYDLVLPREGRYTRDLYLCYETFSRAYPDRELGIRQAVQWALEPTADKRAVAAFLDDFGVWLCDAIDELKAANGLP
jgi:uncharacterized protein